MNPGRNDPCPCGSGKKYKHCCLLKQQAESESPAELAWRRIRRANEGLVPRMLRFVVETYGEFAFDEAWDEFMLWDEDLDEDWADSPQRPLFLPWMLHRWAPDPYDTGVEDERLHDVPPTRAFLDRYDKALDAVTKRYLQACLAAPCTFYEIIDCVPGHHVGVRELMYGQEHVVLERSATRSMQVGDVLYGSLAQVDGIVMLEGCAPIVIPPEDKLPLIEARTRLSSSGDLFSNELLVEWDMELRTLYLNISDRILYPSLPQLQNTDGDAISMQRLVFDIDSPQDVFDALKHLALDASDEELLADAERAGDGTLQRVEFQWLRRGNKKLKHWDNTSLGAVMIDRGHLIVDVNSDERANRFKRIVKKVLGTRARYRVTEIQSMERALEEALDGDAATVHPDPDELAGLPEVQAAMREMLVRHYEGWLSEKLPALKGRTPLQAVKTAEGREMVDALVMQIERSGRTMTPPLDESIPLMLRARLGLASRPAPGRHRQD